MTTFSLTDSLWPQEGLVNVVDPTGARVMGLSIEFMTKGHVLSWAYVQWAASQSVSQDGLICSLSGTPVDEHLPLVSATYLFQRSGESSRTDTE